MEQYLKGQTAIITGGARGIGLGIARELSRRGCQVVLWDLSFAAFKGEAAGFVPALLQDVNVADLASVQNAYAECVGALGPIDIFVNNAGINGPVIDTWEYPVEAWDKVLAVNLTGVFYCTRTVIPDMRARKSGRIINIASMAGKEGNPGICAYAAAKGGLIAFTKGTARELAGSGVFVNAVAPAMTETELFAQMTPEHIKTMTAKIPMGRAVQIEDVARLVAWIASPDCSFTTGFTFDVSGGRAVY
jgi:NAD(P)-dependent dehydrogenase (short-subunit alcohol dehydrogenase family)